MCGTVFFFFYQTRCVRRSSGLHKPTNRAQTDAGLTVGLSTEHDASVATRACLMQIPWTSTR